MSGAFFAPVQEIHVSFSVPTRSQEVIHFLQTFLYEEIKKATISSWTVKLIHLAYSTEGKNPGVLELHKVTAHEVRALSASTSAFRGMATEAIMQSCTWRSRSTFSDFYLGDMCAFLDDIFMMSSSVAGNASVSSIPVTSHQ